jgi:hypothetical protein
LTFGGKVASLVLRDTTVTLISGDARSAWRMILPIVPLACKRHQKRISKISQYLESRSTYANQDNILQRGRHLVRSMLNGNVNKCCAVMQN